MNRYLVKNPFYLCGVLQVKGVEVELTEDQFEELSTKDVIGRPIAATPTEDSDEIKHVGGGYYELPNGDKVKGKDEASAALAALKVGGSGAEAETGGSSDSGAGDA